MLKKQISKALAVVMAGIMLSACSAGPAAPAASSAPAPSATPPVAPAPQASQATAKEKPSKLTMAIALSESEWVVFREKIFPMYKEKTGITVEGLQIENADIEGKVESLHMAKKSEIDVIAPDNMLLYGLVDKGLVYDLSAYEKEIPSEVPGSSYEAFKIDGKLYFMPFRPNVQINYYNENKFKEYGLTPPENWDELLAVSKTFFEKEGTGRVAIQAAGGSALVVSLFEYIRQAGGEPMNVNDEGCVKAFTFMQELWPYLSTESQRANFSIMNTAISTDAAYYGANWPFGVNVIVKEGGKTEVKAYKGFTGPVKRSKVLGGNVLAVAAQSKYFEESMDFIKFLQSKEVQEIFTGEIGWPSIRSDAYGTVEEWQKPYFEAVKEAMEFAEPRPVLHYWADLQKAYNDAFKEIVVDKADPKTTLDKYAEIVAKAKNQ